VIGDTWPAEWRELKDEKTGRPIRQLTAQGNNVHFYFTENSFTQGKNEILFRSDRAAREEKAPHEKPHYNLFRMDLDSGVITQLTDEAAPISGCTKTPDSAIVVFTTGGKLKQLDTRSGAVSVLYGETAQFTLTSPSISANRRYAGFVRRERVGAANGPNYSGFADRYYLTKDSRITLAQLDGSAWFDIFKDTHQLGHFQFSPNDPSIAIFCHEGPWHLVTQRIWGLDLVARDVWPCFRQAEQDSIGHEFWTQDGLIFFDNRGPGHDGTITSHRTQAIATQVGVREHDFTPYVGLMDYQSNLIRKIDMPYYCNHYHANLGNTVLVGDDVDDLVLIDIAGETPRQTTLCYHGTSWHTQDSHCHPTWEWEGRQILYASDRGGRVQLYLIEV
jgi:oligogalacturonide lyase